MSVNAIDGLLAWLADPSSVEGQAWTVQVQHALRSELGAHLLQVWQTPSSHFTMHSKHKADLSDYKDQNAIEPSNDKDQNNIEPSSSEPDAWQFIRQFPLPLGKHLFYFTVSHAPPDCSHMLGVHVTTDARFAKRLGALGRFSFSRHLCARSACTAYYENCDSHTKCQRCFIY